MTLAEYKKMVSAFQTIVETMLGVTPGTFSFMNESINPEKW